MDKLVSISSNDLFQRIADLTRRLFQVPKAELEAEELKFKAG